MQSDQVGYWICNAVFCIVIPLLIRNPAWLGRAAEWLREHLVDPPTHSAGEPDEPYVDLGLARLGRQANRLHQALADDHRASGMRQRANRVAYERVLAEMRNRSDGWRVSTEVAARRTPASGWVSETIDVRWR